jgi:hypothetical protein
LKIRRGKYSPINAAADAANLWDNLSPGSVSNELSMKDMPPRKSWTAGMIGDAPPRHMIHGHLRQQNQERVQEMTDDGIAEVQVVCGTDHECPACAALEGRIFSVYDAPAIPPETCSCVPHCTCILTAITDS